MNIFMSAKSGSAFGGKKTISVFALVLFAVLSFPAQAADFYLPQDKTDQNLVISSTETYSDLYTAGPNLTVNSKVSGDLVAAGGTVTFDGNVENELLLAGGNMTLGGTVGGTARIVGGNYSISSQIGGDLALAGGNVTLTEKALVKKDLLAAAGNLTLNAPVLGKARIAGGNIYINSKINGDVRIRAGQKVVFGPKADIAGKVIYYAPQAANFTPGSKVPNVEFNMVAKKSYKNKFTALLSFAFLIRLLAWILAGFVALKLFKQKIQEIFTEVTQNPWSNLGMGLVWLICTPIAAIILLISFVGYYLGGVLAVAYVLALLAACLLSALMIGHLLMKYLNKSAENLPDWQLVVVGVVVLSVLKFIPILGWAVAGVFFLISLGGLARIIKKQLSN
jgi:hypothetical protein